MIGKKLQYQGTILKHIHKMYKYNILQCLIRGLGKVKYYKYLFILIQVINLNNFKQFLQI